MSADIWDLAGIVRADLSAISFDWLRIAADIPAKSVGHATQKEIG